MPDLASLSRAWAESDALLDELLKQMEPVFAGVRSQLLDALTDLPTTASGTLRSAPPVAQLLDQLHVERSIVSGLGSILPQAAESTRPLLEEVGLSVPTVSRRAQLVFLAKAQEKVEEVLGSMSEGLAGLLTQAASTPIPQDELTQIAASLIDAPMAQVRTISNTALAGLQRETAATAAQGLPGGLRESYWIYVGPKDQATRPFCRACVDKAFPSHLLTRLRNGQGLPVRAYGGGYNCRHSLTPVSAAYLSAVGIQPATSSDVSLANRAARR